MSELKGKESKIRKALYIEEALADEVDAAAKKADISFNSAAVQLITLGLQRVDADYNLGD